MSGQYDRKDKLYYRAKEEGYRSRAAYKLKELNQKHKLIKAGDKVLDLGAWPGGWTQVAAQIVGRTGKVVAIDLVELESVGDFEQVTLLTGDARDDASIAQCESILGGLCDAVISDMSTKLTGIKEVDQAGSVGCAELALFIAGRVLNKGGCLIMKVFKCSDIDQFIRATRPQFGKIIRAELEATRRTSNEFYLVCQDFKRPIA